MKYTAPATALINNDVSLFRTAFFLVNVFKSNLLNRKIYGYIYALLAIKLKSLSEINFTIKPI